MGHTCGTLLRRTLLWDTLVGHSCTCGTLLWDTLVGHSCGTLWDTLVGHSYGTLLWDTLVGYSCRTLLWDTLVGHSCGILLYTLVGHSCRSHSCGTLLTSVFVRDFLQKSRVKSQNERFVRDFLQKSHVKSPKRAFRTRLPPKVTLRGCKTSVSYETSSKSHASSLKNERFARDFLQKSSGNTHRSTHITQPCQAISRFQPLQTTPAHTPIPM